MSDIGKWFIGLPKFTRFWFSGTIIVSLLARFGLLSPSSLILHFKSVVVDHQIWRLLTALFYYPLEIQTGFHFLCNSYLLVHFSTGVENGNFFDERPAEYAHLLMITLFICSFSALYFQIMILMDSMVLSILLIYTYRNPDQNVRWFGTQFPIQYLSWIIVALNLVLTGGALPELIGILAGYIYCLMKFKFPTVDGGEQMIQAPLLLEFFFPPDILPSFMEHS